jgi:hypothetical protein
MNSLAYHSADAHHNNLRGNSRVSFDWPRVAAHPRAPGCLFAG